MAIAKQIEVRVLVDGQPVQEYDDPNGAESSPRNGATPGTEKYVECLPDKNFKIDFRTLPGFDWGEANGLSAQITVDGFRMHTPSFRRERLKHLAFRRVSEGSNIKVGNCWQVRRYRFGKLQLDDCPPDNKSTECKIKCLGTINVTLHRRIYQPQCRSTGERSASEHEPQSVVSEKVLKGLAKDSYTMLDAGNPTKSRKRLVGVKVDKEPLVSFVFSYLTRAGLEKLSIIERPRSPTPLEDRDFDTLTNTEKLELFGRLKAAKEAGQKAIKKERAESTARYLALAKRQRDDTIYDGDDVQVVKKSKTQPNIEIVELDD